MYAQQLNGQEPVWKLCIHSTTGRQSDCVSLMSMLKIVG